MAWLSKTLSRVNYQLLQKGSGQGRRGIVLPSLAVATGSVRASSCLEMLFEPSEARLYYTTGHQVNTDLTVGETKLDSSYPLSVGDSDGAQVFSVVITIKILRNSSLRKAPARLPVKFRGHGVLLSGGISYPPFWIQDFADIKLYSAAHPTLRNHASGYEEP
ncbi:hypothetical protein P691DRAFT_791350 [Macrolepiota fuliginosa MF-IS2]|uniref:Uncharacterized protein n=1 Tax=Macrolepiota fuliginosa MF-IS2 TaxID=1400762 RepID=A0A9P5XGA1_9AGAR|nr:hypothetical protein P691DRAFT_791350 [Macrolepiota fuliginosa MF-IS2]